MKEKLGYEWHRSTKHNAAKFTPQRQAWINNFIERKKRNRERENLIKIISALFDRAQGAKYYNSPSEHKYNLFQNVDRFLFTFEQG